MNIDDTLDERGRRYGVYTSHADITQGIKVVMNTTPGWARLAPHMKETLDMVAHKIGRILNGDPDYHDSWHDIVGYAKLSADAVLKAETDRAQIQSTAKPGALRPFPTLIRSTDSTPAPAPIESSAKTEPYRIYQSGEFIEVSRDELDLLFQGMSVKHMMNRRAGLQ